LFRRQHAINLTIRRVLSCYLADIAQVASANPRDGPCSESQDNFAQMIAARLDRAAKKCRLPQPALSCARAGKAQMFNSAAARGRYEL
jgi:hypothetical protein